LCELATPLPPFFNEFNEQPKIFDADDEEWSDKG